MKKTSRRNFGKQLTGAIATLPLAAIVSSKTEARSPLRTRSASVGSLVDERYHENTPPPIELVDGSFAIHIKTLPTTTAQPLTRTGSGHSWVYKGKLDTSSDNNIEHIKILHGSGESVFRDVEASGSVITIELQDENDGRVGTLTVFGDRDFFQVASFGYGSGNADGQLVWTHENGKPHHKHHFTHQGGPGNKEFRITGIRITKGGATTLNLALPPVSGTPFESQGYRILVWLAD